MSQDKDKKKKEEKGGGKGGGGKGGNVFDQGNELLLEHAEMARTELGAVDHIQPGSSMLSRAQRGLEAEKEKQEDEDQAARAVLRDQAVVARDKVMILMHQMMSDPKEMGALAGITDRKAAAIQLLESLAVKLPDVDLDALAGYDHEDMTFRMIISAEAYQEVKQLSAQGMKFGAFGTVLWEMAYEQMQMVVMSQGRDKGGETDLVDTAPTRSWMTRTIGLIEMAQSSDRI